MPVSTLKPRKRGWGSPCHSLICPVQITRIPGGAPPTEAQGVQPPSTDHMDGVPAVVCWEAPEVWAGAAPSRGPGTH